MLTVADHIEIDSRGIARISGSRIKVAQLIRDHKQWGWNAPEIHAQLPHLSLAQIHAAFVYYYDHQEEIDALLEKETAEADVLEKQLRQPQPTVEQLRSRTKS